MRYSANMFVVDHEGYAMTQRDWRVANIADHSNNSYALPPSPEGMERRRMLASTHLRVDTRAYPCVFPGWGLLVVSLDLDNMRLINYAPMMVRYPTDEDSVYIGTIYPGMLPFTVPITWDIETGKLLDKPRHETWALCVRPLERPEGE